VLKKVKPTLHGTIGLRTGLGGKSEIPKSESPNEIRNPNDQMKTSQKHCDPFPASFFIRISVIGISVIGISFGD
jgi:hypothetical protein